jgi:hypothetical protein
MRDVPIEDPNQKALLNQMIIASHLVRELAEKDAYLNFLKEQRAEALAEIAWLKQRISELGGDQTGSVAWEGSRDCCALADYFRKRGTR